MTRNLYLRYFANFNMTLVDDTHIYVGDYTMFGPNVTIGDNVVVGAGSIVTKDLLDNVVVVGNPCKVLREVNDHDKEYFFKDRKINL